MRLQWLDRVGLRPGRFRFLLFTLLAYCVGAALYPPAADAFAAFLLVTTLIELDPDESRVLRKSLIVVVAFSALTRLTNTFGGLDRLILGTNVSDVFFAVLATFAVHRAAVREKRPAGDRVVGAICAYLLIGFAWAAIYSTIETVAPNSFNVPDAHRFSNSSSSFIYFSFVTLSTLGYGDITPVTRLAGTAAWMEAITGQLYLAITIASLLSVALAERRNRQSDSGASAGDGPGD